MPVSVVTNPTSLLGVGGVGQQLVFEWNRTDASQFSTTPDYSESAGTPTGDPANSTLSKVSVAERGPALRIAGSGSDTLASIAIFLADEELPFSGTRRDAIFELEFYGNVAGHNGWIGVCIADPGGSFHSLNALGPAHGNQWASQVEAGVWTRPSQVAGGPDSSLSLLRFEMRGEKQAGDPPNIVVYSSRHHKNLAQQPTPVASGSDAQRNSARGFGGNAALASSWDDLDVKRWGLVLQAGSPQTLPTYDLLGIRVWIIE